jgi:hypothetical protein
MRSSESTESSACFSTTSKTDAAFMERDLRQSLRDVRTNRRPKSSGSRAARPSRRQGPEPQRRGLCAGATPDEFREKRCSEVTNAERNTSAPEQHINNSQTGGAMGWVAKGTRRRSRSRPLVPRAGGTRARPPTAASRAAARARAMGLLVPLYVCFGEEAPRRRLLRLLRRLDARDEVRLLGRPARRVRGPHLLRRVVVPGELRRAFHLHVRLRRERDVHARARVRRSARSCPCSKSRSSPIPSFFGGPASGAAFRTDSDGDAPYGSPQPSARYACANGQRVESGGGNHVDDARRRARAPRRTTKRLLQRPVPRSRERRGRPVAPLAMRDPRAVAVGERLEGERSRQRHAGVAFASAARPAAAAPHVDGSAGESSRRVRPPSFKDVAFLGAC